MANSPGQGKIRIGTKTATSQQKDYLERARRASHPSDVWDSIGTVIRDTDITSGKEELLPEWIQVFENNKSQMRRMLPDEYFSDLEKLFKSLSAIDPAALKLNFSEIKASFLLGAGASKPNPSNIPTVKELLPELFTRARKLDRDDLDKLATFCEERKIGNIEDLLTAAQLANFSSRNPSVMQLISFLLYRNDQEELDLGRRRRIAASDLSSVAFLQDTLQVLFGLLSSTMLPAKPNEAHKAIAEYAKAHDGTAIITTNYDCCMDLALGDEGVDFSYGIDFTNTKDTPPPTTPTTRLIKLHGSLNWFYCETCQEVQKTNIRQTVKNYLEDNEPYPVIAICKDCGGQRRGLLVPPLAMKFDLAPPLLPLTEQVNAAFECSEVIVVVGFSFADADVYITRMVSKSLQTSDKQKLVIVDPDHSIVEKIRRRLKASIPNFDGMRIIKLSGDCADVLPKLLKGQLTDTADKAENRVSTQTAAKVRNRKRRRDQGNAILEQSAENPA